VEFGHIQVGTDEPCACGRDGCLEAFASAASIARRYSQLAHDAGTGAPDVVDRLGRDEIADRVWHEAIAALADGLNTLSVLLTPQLVVMGGGLAQAGDQLLQPLRAALEARVRVGAVPRLTLASHGLRAGVVGAALLAQDGWKAER
jgi:glucokinase